MVVYVRAGSLLKDVLCSSYLLRDHLTVLLLELTRLLHLDQLVGRHELLLGLLNVRIAGTVWRSHGMLHLWWHTADHACSKLPWLLLHHWIHSRHCLHLWHWHWRCRCHHAGTTNHRLVHHHLRHHLRIHGGVKSWLLHRLLLGHHAAYATCASLVSLHAWHFVFEKGSCLWLVLDAEIFHGSHKVDLLEYVAPWLRSHVFNQSVEHIIWSGLLELFE